jgi:hypothetical protein
MIIKYFDEFEGEFIDITGTTGQGLEYGPSGWTQTSKSAYKSFVGELSQSGGSDPSITTFFNNTGATFTITRDGAGQYRLESNISIFVKTEMWWYIGNNQLTENPYTFQAFKGATLEDDALEHTSFEFRKY